MIKKLILFTLYLPALLWAQSSYGVINYSTMDYEHEKNINEVRSIASITKLFTAKTVLDSNVSLSERIKVQGRSGGRFARGIYIERYELLRASLMSSDNLATESLAMGHPGGYQQFLEDVNDNISLMGLTNTTIVDSTGILALNKSSVKDLAEFLFILRNYPVIQYLSSEKFYTYEYRRGKRTVKVNLKNTNPQMWTYDNIVLTKTGFTTAAGRCLAMLVEKNGELYAVISLGNKTLVQRSRNIEELMSEIGER
jgi:D-alanyl-D-alanine endopeptidase (penicillin-binding protein 7)